MLGNAMEKISFYFLLFSGYTHTTTLESPCMFWTDSIYFNGFCYRISSGMSNWTDAQVMCKKDIVPAKLAEPKLETNLFFLIKVLTLAGEDWWIGGIMESSVPHWASSKEVITSGNITLSGNGTCLQVSDSRKERLLPVMSNDMCDVSKKYICEYYVGNPCIDKFPGADYSGGRCYKMQNNQVHWSEARTICDKDYSILAEFYTEESYYFMKNLTSRFVGKDVLIPANSKIFLEDYNVTLSDTGYFSYRIRSCKGISVYLWSDANTTAALRSSSSLTTGSVPYGDYYVIDYGLVNVTSSNFTYCSRGTCKVLSSANPGVNFQCRNFIKPFFSWNNASNDIWVSEASIYINFNNTYQRVLNITRMAIAAGNWSAVWKLKDPVYGSDVFLGSNDTNHEGSFTWMSTDAKVNINDWLLGEPNDWPQDGGEDNMCWRSTDEFQLGLNDVNGTAKSARPLCQKDAMNVSYLIPLPETATSSVKSPEVHVSTVSSEVVYLQFQQNFPNGSSAVTYDWVTSFHNTIFKMSPDLEMKDTGFSKGMVLLKSTRHVTVVLFQNSTTCIGTTLVYPVHYFTSGYFILIHASSMSGHHVTISALLNGTEVTVKYPRNQTTPITVTVNGMTFQQIKMTKLSLASLESVQLQSISDLSGSFIYSNKPVMVYMGTKSIQTSGTSNTDTTLDMALSVDSLTNRYINFPTYTSTVSGTDIYKILALYDDTNITINGLKQQNLLLQKSGDFATISLPSDGIYSMTSDIYHPFYVVRLYNLTTGSCLTSLEPETQWSKQYSVYVRLDRQVVYVVMEKNATSKFIVDDMYISANLCTPVTGTTFVGCVMNLTQGLHNLGFNETNNVTSAYTSPTTGSRYSYCHSLGTADYLKDVQVKFPALQYLQLNESDRFRHPLLPNVTDTTTATSTSVQTTTVGTTDSTTTAQPTGATLTNATYDTSAAAYSTAATSETVATETSPTASYETTSQLASTSSTTNTSVECRFTEVKNLSRDDLVALLSSIQTELLVAKTTVSAYRQQHYSIWEDRPSCHAIGISGILIVTSCIACLSSSDIFRLAKFLVKLLGDKASQNVHSVEEEKQKGQKQQK